MNPQVFPLVQREPCPCDLYISRPIGDWSDCVLDRDIVTVSANGRPAQGVCGSGSRYRRIGCYNKDNDLVEPRRSHENLSILQNDVLLEYKAVTRYYRPMRESLCDRDDGLEEEPCLMPCPTDCLLSEWTSWGECSTMCGPGVHNRTRKGTVILDAHYLQTYFSDHMV
uniref:Spondin-like TSP1 domain-containing protein n=1 Tax=Timema poppense TaxID=170557 RepID=A0A7R9DG01_TIMPO|nr:unnamed protein product [Timema poppensis]